MAWAAEDINQSGRVAVVTGANGGLGLEVARELARPRQEHRRAPRVRKSDLQARSVRENGGGRSQRLFRWAVRMFGMSPARAALSLPRAATDPGAIGGALYAPRWASFGPPVRRPLLGRSRSRESMAKLWEVSERETGIAFDVRAS